MQTILKIFLIYFLLGFNLLKADGHASNENWSFYTGTFDFSDEGKKSTLFGIQHINTGKNKESFLGILQPVTGLMMTADNAAYVYTYAALSAVIIKPVTGCSIPKKLSLFFPVLMCWIPNKVDFFPSSLKSKVPV